MCKGELNAKGKLNGNEGKANLKVKGIAHGKLEESCGKDRGIRAET